MPGFCFSNSPTSSRRFAIWASTVRIVQSVISVAAAATGTHVPISTAKAGKPKDQQGCRCGVRIIGILLPAWGANPMAWELNKPGVLQGFLDARLLDLGCQRHGRPWQACGTSGDLHAVLYVRRQIVLEDRVPDWQELLVYRQCSLMITGLNRVPELDA